MSQEKSLVTIGGRLKFARKERNLTLASLAKTVGSSQGYLSQVEHGLFIPSDKLVVAICSKLGVSETWLRSGEGEIFSDPSILASRHTDLWLQTFLQALVNFWNSGDYVAVFMIDDGFLRVFDDRWLTWVAARRSIPSAAELQFIPQLNELYKAADDERLVEVAPSTARLLIRLLSLLAYSKASDYCDFLKEWWDKASEDERAWARVELKRRLPMLFQG